MNKYDNIVVTINPINIVPESNDPTGGRPMGHHKDSMWAKVDQIFYEVFLVGESLPFLIFQKRLKALFTAIGFTKGNCYNYSRYSFIQNKFEWAGWVTLTSLD